MQSVKCNPINLSKLARTWGKAMKELIKLPKTAVYKGQRYNVAAEPDKFVNLMVVEYQGKSTAIPMLEVTLYYKLTKQGG